MWPRRRGGGHRKCRRRQAQDGAFSLVADGDRADIHAAPAAIPPPPTPPAPLAPPPPAQVPPTFAPVAPPPTPPPTPAPPIVAALRDLVAAIVLPVGQVRIRIGLRRVGRGRQNDRRGDERQTAGHAETDQEPAARRLDGVLIGWPGITPSGSVFPKHPLHAVLQVDAAWRRAAGFEHDRCGNPVGQAALPEGKHRCMRDMVQSKMSYPDGYARSGGILFRRGMLVIAAMLCGGASILGRRAGNCGVPRRAGGG